MSITSHPRPAGQITHQASKPSSLRRIWSRAERRSLATAQAVYPMVLVFAIFATVLVATIALRLLIWLPISRF